MTLKNNRAPLLSNIKLCASFHHHMWIPTGVTARKRLSGSWTLWPWSLTLTFCMDITSVNGNNWKFQDDTMTGTLSKGCDGRTDRRKSVLRDAWSQLKMVQVECRKLLRTPTQRNGITSVTNPSCWAGRLLIKRSPYSLSGGPPVPDHQISSCPAKFLEVLNRT